MAAQSESTLSGGSTLSIRRKPVAEKRKYFSAWERKRQSQWRTRLLMFMGGECTKCQNNDYRVLQIDHVHGGGSKDRRENPVSSAFNMAKKVFAKPDDFQLLCANCNWIKRYDNHEFGTRCAVGGAI
jgi:hypothetical protein